MLLLLFTILTYISTSRPIHTQAKPRHECVHNKIKKTPVQQIYTDYGANFESRRRLSTSYQNIRIKPYWNSTSTVSISAAKLLKAQYIISAAIDYLQNMIKVIPVSGNLHTISSAWSSYCGEARVPSLHMKSGAGVSGVDTIIYVTSVSSYCGENTLAWAQYCSIDQYGRPTSGNINICPSKLDSEIDWRTDVDVVVHEILHTLVMSPELFDGDNNDKFGKVQSYTKSGVPFKFITSTNVRNVARNHFGCNTLEGAPLEDDGSQGSVGSHWESLHLYSEIMNSASSSQMHLSKFTFALLKDSTWYQVDETYQQPFIWGKNEGCNFFDMDCLSSNSISNFGTNFCSTDGVTGCTFDYVSTSECYVFRYKSSIPVNNQYYTDSTLGGYESMEHCPIEIADYSSQTGLYTGSCIDNNSMNKRCSRITTNTGITSSCLTHQCNNYNTNTGKYASVTITYNGVNVICNNGDDLSKINKTVSNVEIHCPNVDDICYQQNPFNCQWGWYNNNLNKCICEPGWNGTTCKDEKKLILTPVASVNQVNVTIIFLFVFFIVTIFV